MQTLWLVVLLLKGMTMEIEDDDGTTVRALKLEFNDDGLYHGHDVVEALCVAVRLLLENTSVPTRMSVAVMLLGNVLSSIEPERQDEAYAFMYEKAKRSIEILELAEAEEAKQQGTTH